MRRITLTFTFLGTLIYQSFSQLAFERNFEVEVTKNAQVLDRAWEGGLNYPIFSNVDFDNNGVQDLIAFDKSGSRMIVFKNENLDFEPINFDLKLERWVLFRDFNCDGFPDIFTGSSSGLRIYKNNGDFSFSLETNQLQTDLGVFESNLLVTNEDIPGIADIDGDGDLDILTFEINGVYVEYHKNLSIENTGTCGLDFELSSSCWGRFEENATTNQILLNKPCSAGDLGSFRSGGQHAGSTITTLDADYNGAIDLIVGDISFNNLTYLKNGGSNLFSNINQMDVNFPNYDNPINLHLFPYASYVDANNDDKSDLLIVSNNAATGDNQNIHYYKNIGLNKDTFSYQSNDFLVGEMLDFGTSAYPIWVDENQDGLLDILIGNNAVNANGTFKASLALLRNTGTASQPKFELVDEDYLDFSQNDEPYVYPAIGDIDNDGDDDLLLGLQNGKMLYMNNLANAGNPYQFVLASAEFEGIDVGNYAAPVLYDINLDNNLDLTVGHQNGSLYYYENQSLGGYDYSVETEDFGNVTTQDFATGIFFGYSTPFYYESDGKLNLLVGGESGRVQGYLDIRSEFNSTINLDFYDFYSLKDGGFSKPLLGDLNNDNCPEFIVGNQSGGLAYYKGLKPDGVKKPIVTGHIEFQQYSDFLLFSEEDIISLKLYNLNGQLIDQSSTQRLNLPKTKGIYFVLAEVSNKIISVKVLK